MSKVNIDDFLEIECASLNEDAMKRKELNSSPGFKIQLFLRNSSAMDGLKGYAKKEECTAIICEHYSKENGKCEASTMHIDTSRSNCHYIRLKKK